MGARKRVEREFGVPFPGRILERARWTATRTELPPDGVAFPWEAVFGRKAGRVVDLGCGNGRYLVQSALRRPLLDHLGIDLVPQAIFHAVRRSGERGLSNVRFAVADAQGFLFSEPESSLDEVHLYHPQPYYDAAKRERRMLTPELVAAAHRALKPGGLFVLQTDNPHYWRYIETTVPVLFFWTRLQGPWPDAPQGRTRREILARRKGLRIFRGFGTPRKEYGSEEVRSIVARLPRPAFDANRPRYR